MLSQLYQSRAIDFMCICLVIYLSNDRWLLHSAPNDTAFLIWRFYYFRIHKRVRILTTSETRITTLCLKVTNTQTGKTYSCFHALLLKM